MTDSPTVPTPHPEGPTPGAPSSGMPRDLLEQMRGRVRLLALLMLAAFAIDPILFFGFQLLARIEGRTRLPRLLTLDP